MNHVIPKLYFILSWGWYFLLQDSRTYPSFGFRKPPVTLWRWLREPITLIALNFWDIESEQRLANLLQHWRHESWYIWYDALPPTSKLSNRNSLEGDNSLWSFPNNFQTLRLCARGDDPGGDHNTTHPYPGLIALNTCASPITVVLVEGALFFFLCRLRWDRNH